MLIQKGNLYENFNPFYLMGKLHTLQNVSTSSEEVKQLFRHAIDKLNKPGFVFRYLSNIW